MNIVLTAYNNFKKLIQEVLENTTIKLGKVLVRFLQIATLTTVSIRGRANFLQFMRYSGFNEKTFRNNFNKTVPWASINTELAHKELQDQSHVVIAIDPAHINKAGECTPGIGMYWSGTESKPKHGLEILALCAIDYTTGRTIMIGAEQSLPDRDDGKHLSMTDCYLAGVRRHEAELMSLSTVMVADSFFSRKTFVLEIVKDGFTLVSKLPVNASLRYLADEAFLQRRGKRRGYKPRYAGKVDTSTPDSAFLEKRHIGKCGTIYTGVVHSVSLDMDIRIVFGKFGRKTVSILFSTDVSMCAEDIIRIYNSRFRIEFGIRDAKQFTGLGHSQARDKRRLAFAFNLSFFTRNMLQTEVDRLFPNYSVGMLKKIISDTDFALKIMQNAVPDKISCDTVAKIEQLIAKYVGVAA